AMHHAQARESDRIAIEPGEAVGMRGRGRHRQSDIDGPLKGYNITLQIFFGDGVVFRRRAARP
ncbi:hypothetical protein AB2C95_32125, partial [Pseudomonas aeruginosa]